MVRVAPITVICLLSVALPGATTAQERDVGGVLTIHSGAVDFPINPVFEAGIRQELFAARTPPVAYFSEYLDFDRFPNAETSSALRDYIYRKYHDRRVRVVIATRRPSLEFVLDHRADLFPNASVVYAAAYTDAGRRPGSGITGVRFGNASVETVKLALELHPDVRRVYVVAISSDQEAVRMLRNDLRPFSARGRLAYVEAQTLQALIAKVKTIPSGNLIVYVWFQSQSTAHVSDAFEAARLVAAAARVPVYSAFDTTIGTGVVGGIVGHTRATGARLGEMARRILNGTPAGDIPVVDAPVVPVFDWRQLQRWRIDPSRLPRDAEIRFRVPTTWESYGGYVTPALLVVVAQSVLITALLTQRRRRCQAEETIRAREATLQASFQRIRQLARGLIHAQEAARVAMARDLHDDICQEMVGVAMAVDNLTNSTGRIQDLRTQYALAKLHRWTLEIADRIRRISHELHPASLQLLGLAPAVKTHCLEVEKRHGVEVSFQTTGDFKHIHPDVALCLFRIAQEALRNAVAHGEARHLRVSIARLGGDVQLAVNDDGQGFDVESVRRAGRGLGLVSLEERAHQVGGEVLIISVYGQGTSVIARVPAATTLVEPGDGYADEPVLDSARPSVATWIAEPL